MTEKFILSNEEDYQKIQAELSSRKKPSVTLRYMMQAFENYRQAKKMGWSRSWNKYNVVNFQSFKLNVTDRDLCQSAMKVIEEEAKTMPEEVRPFVTALLGGNEPPMGFLFFQEFNDKDRRFEGVVVSYGRVNSENKRYRDRLDLILESEVIDGCSQGLSRMRLYVDPYLGTKDPLWQTVKEGAFHEDTMRLFGQLAGLSWAWENEGSRVWKHWVTDYIDYFGPRQWAMVKSYFHDRANPDCRIGLDERQNPNVDSKAA